MKPQLLLLIVICSIRLAGAQPVVWTGKDSSINITQQVAVLEDSEGQYTIDQVSSAAGETKFKKSDQEVLQFGFSKSVYWLRFSIKNTTGQKLYLELPQAFLPFADLYFRDKQGHWQVLRAGYLVNLKQKPVNNIYQVYPLLDTNEPIYIRFLSYCHPFPVNLWTESAFLTKANRQLMTYGIYVGLLLFVLINNLFLFFSLRRFTYLLYAVVLLGNILNAANVMEGFILYAFPHLDLRFWFLFTPEITLVPTVWFGVLFLELKKYKPRLYRLGIGLVCFTLVYSLFFVPFLPDLVVDALNQVVSLTNLTFCAVIGIKAGRAGNRIGYYYALSYIFLTLFIFTESVYDQTGFPRHLTEVSHVALGILLEALILAFLLSLRFDWERKTAEQARVEAQQRLLEKTHENERILQAQNETLEREVAERTRDIEHKSQELNVSLQHLKATQAQLIQKEKMASLGELTAGVAHEIQNPLNFVNNFSDVSSEIIDELFQEHQKPQRDDHYETELLTDLRDNLHRITHHGQRASGIVKDMLGHSRSSTKSEVQPTDINALVDEYLWLAYHSQQASGNDVNYELITQLDPTIGQVPLVRQEISRVLLNLFNNAFYAVTQRQKQSDVTYRPTIQVSTLLTKENVQIHVKDNGTGIPKSAQQKIFQPFFTTKPTGEGTGLGLSLSYDIITKGHAGSLTVESQEGEGTELVICLPTRDQMYPV